MALAPYKVDVNDLIEEFVKVGGRTLADMKEAWLSKKFSHIFQTSPSVKAAVLMQSLYSTAIGYMVRTNTLPQRLGGLYCLYCLHETQPFNPPFRIYLSLEELKSIKILVIDAKKHDVAVVSILVKIMLEKNMFLYGLVELNESSHNGMVGQIRELQNARVQHAYEKLFASTQIEEYLHLDLDWACDLSMLRELSTNYALAKHLAIQEASQFISVDGIARVAENGESIGSVIGNISEKWNAQRQLFGTQTGLKENLSDDQNDTPMCNEQSANDGDKLQEFGEDLEQELLDDPETGEVDEFELEKLLR